MSDRFIVTGNFTDDPFAIDMAQYIGLREDITDMVRSWKGLEKTEFNHNLEDYYNSKGIDEPKTK